jgi:hypothetical protein
MKPLTIPGYSIVAAALLPQGEGTAPSTLFVAVASHGPGGPAVIVARWNHATGGWSDRQSFRDEPSTASPAAEGGDGPQLALARAYAAYAERLAHEASQLLARGTPLSDAPGIVPFGHAHARGLRAARRKSLDELGHAGWADTLIDAYVDPDLAWRALDARGADHVEHEDELF